ncbi:olefin beta-lactone synthetase [Thermomonas sp. HDW16]|uniref:olefin beta-lactone synthetase n=1 Tax=Thermomonas sp. HDW16 TaxID=2714945 RepID=UPI00140832B1|nr:fatty acid CoA ligase family protein [Thermomonas sp. HDW16]QIL19589.1 AMP-binding protein [Thermomonas sp. HDW16]
MTEASNIAAALPRLARERPDQIAMHCPGRNGAYDIALTYAQLDARSDAIATGLAKRGIVRGTRVVVMVRPTPEFFLVMFALFKAGAVPVLVDPGIDKRALKQCLDEAAADAFIGIPLAMLAKTLLGWAKSARLRITTGKRAWFADATLADIERDGAGAGAQLADTRPDDVAALLFTSGSTGVPKGVVYRHRHFVAQIDMLRDAFGIEAGGIDLPTFPPFALFDPALGLTSIIPDMDPTRPAQADPRRLHAAIKRFGITQLFGSPALMRVLAEHGEPLPTIKRVTSAGAPVPPDVVAKMLQLLPPDAQLWTPYGATECLPVAVIEGRELLTLRERTETGAGTCVGRPVRPNEVRIIRIDDEAIPDWSDALLVGAGQVGEITVAGPSATDAYFNRDAQTRLAKIREVLPPLPLAGEGRGEGALGERIVHRMGDLAYFDGEGRLWFCGRKSQRVVVDASTTLCTEQIEPVFNTHPDVARSALVGVGAKGTQRPVLCVELRAGVDKREWPRIEAELRHLADGYVHTAKVEVFLRYPKPFPVDIRHNAKIGREKLAAWAATQPLKDNA